MKKSPATTHLYWLLKIHRARQSEGGYILVIVMAMVLVLSGLFVTTGLTSKVDKASGKANEEVTTGYYAAEAGLNLRAQAIRQKFFGYNLPNGTSPTSWTDCRDGNGNPIDTVSGKNDLGCQSYDGKFQSINNQENGIFSSRLRDIKVSTFVQDKGLSIITIPPGQDFAGLNAQEYRYDVTSVSFSNQRAGNQFSPTSILQISFKSRLIPIFQFAAFFENDLDFTRPAAMTINGRIHTNNNLFLNASAPIRINGTLTSGKKMYRGEKVTTETCNNDFKVYDPYNSAGTAITNVLNNYVEIPCNGTPRSELTAAMVQNDPATGINKWSDGSSFLIKPEIGRLEVPPTSFLDPKLPTATEFYQYWNNADLRIALKLDAANNDVPLGIEVVDTSRNNIAAATNALNGATCSPVEVNLTGSSYTADDTFITVDNAGSFQVGDALQIVGSATSGVNDFDENVITNISGNTLTFRRPLGKSISNASGVKVSKAVVWTSKTFYNYREKVTANNGDSGKLIRMLNVDVQGLMSCAGNLMGGIALNDVTDGGLVWHFTILGADSNKDVTLLSDPATFAHGNANNYGVRLYNGATLASTNSGAPAIKGLTVATDQAVYIRGDYNSNNKKPASILADSLNVLSNSSPLSDSASCTSYDANFNATTCTGPTSWSSRIPSETTINAAFLAGVDIPGTNNLNNPAGLSTDDTSSGGFNNYPRLHEGWSGVNFNYRGSMVSLGRARRVNGTFCGVQDRSRCNIYSAPTRNWDYDSDFNNADLLPPLSPRVVFLQQERFSRDFEQQASVRSVPNFLATLFPWVSWNR
jgi:Tfp pilus assembly protein PilX